MTLLIQLLDGPSGAPVRGARLRARMAAVEPEFTCGWATEAHGSRHVPEFTASWVNENNGYLAMSRPAAAGVGASPWAQATAPAPAFSGRVVPTGQAPAAMSEEEAKQRWLAARA